MKITGWIVETKNTIYGPFDDAGAAGAYLDYHHQNMAPPFSIRPMLQPLQMFPRRSVTDMLIQSKRDSTEWGA